MRLVLLLMLAFGLASCHQARKREQQVHALVNSELATIDWNDVDSYPIFGPCDESEPKEVQKQCFEQEVVAHFGKALKQFEFTIGQEVDTLVFVDFVVEPNGHITVVNIQKDPEVADLMPEFDGIVIECLKDLPPLSPAIKRGVPVKAKFRLPIYLHGK